MLGSTNTQTTLADIISKTAKPAAIEQDDKIS
jgi:hypothetical protein